MRQVLRACRAAAIALSLALCAAQVRAEPVKVTLLQISDWDRIEGVDGRGGFARLVQILAGEPIVSGGALLIHTGDAISPSLLSGFDKGAHMIEVLNQLPIAAMVLGNHEFDFGPEVARNRIAEANFKIVNSNVVDPDGKLVPGTIERQIVEVKGFKFGFFGVTTPETTVLSSPGAYTFKPVIETAQAQVKALREAGADIVVALAHTGRAEDRELFDLGIIDIVLSGHDHEVMLVYNGRTAMMESGAQAEFVTAIDLSLERVKRGDKEAVVWRPSFRAIDSASVTPDPQAQAMVARFEANLAKELDVEIGKTTVPLDSRRAVVRGEEAVIGNLIADAMRAAVGADVAITNGGGIRADKTYAAGTVLKRRDILAELPFGNRTVKLELTGAQLLAALENGFSQVEQGAGRFPQVSGFKVTVDLKKPAGSRVTAVVVDGQPLDSARSYTLATNDFMARGGDGYAVFTQAKMLIDPAAGKLMANQVIDHVQAKGEIATAVEGRIVKAN